jgi:hypothetical protein
MPWVHRSPFAPTSPTATTASPTEPGHPCLGNPPPTLNRSAAGQGCPGSTEAPLIQPHQPQPRHPQRTQGIPALEIPPPRSIDPLQGRDALAPQKPFAPTSPTATTASPTDPGHPCPGNPARAQSIRSRAGMPCSIEALCSNLTNRNHGIPSGPRASLPWKPPPAQSIRSRAGMPWLHRSPFAPTSPTATTASPTEPGHPCPGNPPRSIDPLQGRDALAP